LIYALKKVFNDIVNKKFYMKKKKTYKKQKR